jgi:hypothetical protein
MQAKSADVAEIPVAQALENFRELEKAIPFLEHSTFCP